MTFFKALCEKFEKHSWHYLAAALDAAKNKDLFLSQFFSGTAGDWNFYGSLPRPQLPFHFQGIYGAGNFAVVLKAVDSKGDEYAFKIMDSDEVAEDAVSDLRLHEYLATVGIAPHLHMSQITEDDMTWIVMDPIEGVLIEVEDEDIDMVAFEQLLRLKRKIGLVHGDMHLGNIAILKGGEYGLIDFDHSFISPAFCPLDFIPLVGSLRVMCESDSNFETFRDQVEDYCARVHGMEFAQEDFGGEGGFCYRGIKSYARFHGFQTLNEVFPNIRH